MADVDGSTQPGEPLGGLAFLEVGSAHAVAEVEEELRDPAHPDAADADEVDLDFAIAKHAVPLIRWNVRDSIYDNQ